jgi:deoxyribonuclease IV
LKNIGLHIRLEDTLTKVAEKAIRLNLKFFQTFITLTNGKYINLKEADVKQFLHLRENFTDIYLHGSYWINLCSAKGRGVQLLKRELRIAKRLQFSHIVLHPGAATGFKTKAEGVEMLAKNLNEVLASENDIQIIIENTTHGNLSIGGDLREYKQLLNLLDSPEKIKFCIDSSHAYGYGYNITTPEGLNKFGNLVEKTIGKENVKLIHLNDTKEALGSKIDKHEVPGLGNIGKDNLQTFINKVGENLPILLELPQQEEAENAKIINDIQNW